MTWHYFDSATGILNGRTFRCSDPSVSPPHIDGMATIQGVTDWESQRVDITAVPPTIVDYIPIRPDQWHYWNAQVKRWLLDPIVAASRERDAEIMQRIKQIDESIIRPVVELQLNPDDAAARQIRDKLLEEKAKLRGELQTLRESI